ncbi:hypothetical protein IAU60_003461 [Kwoniella sp. DSM 27419]
MAPPSQPRSFSTSAASPVHSPAPAAPGKLPPTGPKALRGLATTGSPAQSHSSGFAGGIAHERISFAFPSAPGRGQPPSGPSRSRLPTAPAPINLDHRASPGIPSGPSALNTNGHATGAKAQQSMRAESSRQAASPFRGIVPQGPAAHRSTASASNRASSSSSVSAMATPTGPSGQRAYASRHASPSRSTSPTKRSENDPSYRSSFLSTTETARAKVSISIPTLPNGANRSGPPQITSRAVTAFDRPDRRPSGPSHPPPANGRQQSHRSPADRPPTPPPPDDLPSPPPSPPRSGPSRPSSRLPSRASSPPRLDRALSPPLPAGPSPPSPAFHYRNVPDLPSQPGSVAPVEPPSAPPPPPDEPPKPPKSPTPPYVPPPYQAPPCVYARPGLGNFLLVKGKGKEMEKRMDGLGTEDARPVEVVDPRIKIPADQLGRGRGTMKVRSGFHELDYEWDECSTTPKPPPPPTAVLLTGLSPLTTSDQISKFLRPYGRIKDIDAKMDTKSGMQLGICWVKFEGPLHGKPGTAHDVALQVCKMCDGQRISLTGDERIRVVLDGRGLRTQKAVKAEMERRYPRKPKVLPVSKPTTIAGVTSATPSLVPPTLSTSTPSSAGAQTPKMESTSLRGVVPAQTKQGGSVPSRLYRPTPASFDNPSRLTSLPARPYGLPVPPTLPHRPLGLPQRPDASNQHLSSSFTAAPFSRHASHDNRDGDRERDRERRRDNSRDRQRERDRARERERERDRGRSSYSSYSSDYSSDSDGGRPAYRKRARSPYGNRRRLGPGGRVAPQTSKEDEKAVEETKQALAANGHPHIFIDGKSLPATSTYEPYLRDHFRHFKPSEVLHNHNGWYILFLDNGAAYRVQRVLDGTAVQGHRLALIVKTPPSSTTNVLNRKPTEEGAAPAAVGDANVEKGAWKYLTITKKNRPAPTPAAKVAKPIAKPSALAADKDRRRKVVSSDESSDDEPIVSRQRKRLPSFSSASSGSDNEDEPVLKPATKPEETMDIDVATDSIKVAPVVADKTNAAAKGKKRPAKAKVAKQSKKVKLEDAAGDPVIELVPEVSAEPVVTEIKLDGEALVTPVTALKPKKKVARSEVDKFLASGAVADDEDAYWLGRALEAARDGVEPSFSDDEEVEMDDKHPLYHTAGAWRAEGWKKIPQIQKSSYLPQRNRATAAVEESGAGGGVTTGRTARLAGRDQHRQTAAVAASANATVESDLFAFNQLRIRKKQLRFARSAIEGYGLYAMETIHVGEMVCEYVGELCRAAVAEVREQRYLKQGIGSSYLFRIDNDIVCDATFKGSVSRLINHSCDPSANAKIIKVNGQSKIVIYAERTLHPGEEILYDYKFPLESDPALRVPCLCGAATCRGWLN